MAIAAKSVASGSGVGALVDVVGAAARLGVSERHVRRLVAERRIPFIKWGRLLRFDEQDLEVWINAARVPAVDPNRASRRM
jgi:excisionase family DNA binding protein